MQRILGFCETGFFEWACSGLVIKSRQSSPTDNRIYFTEDSITCSKIILFPYEVGKYPENFAK
jgi:hypothetical protein